MKQNQKQKQKQAELISQLEEVIDLKSITSKIRDNLDSLVSFKTNESEKQKKIEEIKDALNPLLQKFKTGKFPQGIALFSPSNFAGEFINKLSCDKKMLAFIKLALDNFKETEDVKIPNFDILMESINIDELRPLEDEVHQEEEVDIILTSYNIFRNIMYGIPEDDKDLIALKASGL